MKQEIISILTMFGVLGFIGCFLAGAVMTLISQFDDEISWDDDSWIGDDWGY